MTPPPRTGVIDLKPEGVFVYEAHDWCGALLYVGITNNLIRRMASHSRESVWWHDAVSVTWTEFPTREAAAKEEARRIRELRPANNKAHNLAATVLPVRQRTVFDSWMDDAKL